tara:strand:+ start:15129 stop:15680 length:552 start_codon:yes stop_codon:yes gene_type:complete
MIKINKDNHDQPSEWVMRFSNYITPKSKVLDVACGSGRHSSLMLSLGHRVTSIDIDVSGLFYLKRQSNLRIIETDLENKPWPLGKEKFQAIIVTNYLYRPLIPQLVNSLSTNGLLIYETFAKGNEVFGRPRNPKYLLDRGELISFFSDKLNIIAYEDLEVISPRKSVKQRICASNHINSVTIS